MSETTIASTSCSADSLDRYKCCELLNVTQHIDLYGRNKSTYNERRTTGYMHRKENDKMAAVTAIGAGSKSFSDCPSTSNKEIQERLKKFTITTKKINLYPGEDRLSKFARKMKQKERIEKELYGALKVENYILPVILN